MVSHIVPGYRYRKIFSTMVFLRCCSPRWLNDLTYRDSKEDQLPDTIPGLLKAMRVHSAGRWPLQVMPWLTVTMLLSSALIAGHLNLVFHGGPKGPSTFYARKKLGDHSIFGVLDFLKQFCYTLNCVPLPSPLPSKHVCVEAVNPNVNILVDKKVIKVK